jgi:hypothetical protein
MSQTHADELLLAVGTFLRSDLLPQLEGFSAYTTRVAANSLAIVARELQLGPELERLDAKAAAVYEMQPEDGPVARQFALKLRDDELAADANLVQYLKQRTLQSLAIDNPKYSGYLLARERWSTNSEGDQS